MKGHGSTSPGPGHAVYFLQYSFSPLHGCRNHCVGFGAVPGIEQIFGGFEVARHQDARDDPDHPFPPLVHAAMIHFRFLFV